MVGPGFRDQTLAVKSSKKRPKICFFLIPSSYAKIWDQKKEKRKWVKTMASFASSATTGGAGKPPGPKFSFLGMLEVVEKQNTEEKNEERKSESHW